jgi:hypothetical protein
MGRLETVSTASVPANKKMRFWNEAVSSAVAPAAADPLDQETFQGQLKLLALGSLRIAEIRGGASNVRCFPARSRGTDFVLQLILSGEIFGRPEGWQIRLGAGDRSSRLTEHRMRIRSYIEEHLCDPDLTPESIAAALRITSGYLHRLFSDGHESIARPGQAGSGLATRLS